MTYILRVPSLDDGPSDFVKLFGFLADLRDRRTTIEFDLSHCAFLGQNAVAFVGGLIRFVQDNGCSVTVRWTEDSKLFRHLASNGFNQALGFEAKRRSSTAIPYREDNTQDKLGIVDYLSNKWLGRGWVHVSEELRDAIVGRAWEIYANAFEHGQSHIGVYSCGQYYPKMGLLKLTVVDFGVGIPHNVRGFLADPLMSSAMCLKWALLPGKTTLPVNDTGRGLGLDLLRGLVAANDGKLELYSHDGYACINQTGETFIDRASSFPGTLLNVTLKCDERLYRLGTEMPIDSIFG
jgi:hypothetical protein